MAMFSGPITLKKLAEKFAALPGIGRKSAWRLAFHVLTMEQQEIESFAKVLLDAHNNIKRCVVCQNLTDNEICAVCADDMRRKELICVVESSKDVIAFEQSRSFDGLYHVLHGLISPMDGIGPDDLSIKQLLFRLQDDSLVKEVILATSPTVEGDVTAMYISRLLKPLNVIVSRLAYGVPVGSELQYADEMTISKALENRNIL